MKKRILSLICVLALCLGLLPVTALAADAPNTLWVGQTQITESGCYENKNGTWTRVDGAEPASGQFYYDGNGTLTLNNATIQGRGNSSKAEPQDYGIYAATTSDQSVSLTIKLIGSNTVSGYSGICVDASNGNGNSTLVIQSVGNDPKDSLEAIGSGWNGITISSQSGNASLTINNASVVANIEGQSYHGVSIKSNSQGSPALSLSVDGGSLTAQSTNGYGILFSVLYGTTDPSTSMTVQNNALVKATSIYASQVSEPTPQGTGIVFDGNTGTVYGAVTLQEDLEIGEGESLTIGDGASLDTNGKLTVNGGTLNGSPNGDVTYKVTGVSLNKDSLTLDVGSSETLTATVEPDDATNKNVTWQSDSADVATVQNGTVTAVGEGETTIRVTTEDGNKTATCTVVVTHGNLVHTPKQDATCNKPGTQEYWTCVSCGRHYSDVSATIEVDPSYLIIPQLSCPTQSTSSSSTQPTATYDDGGPFTTDQYGNVYDRWGNEIWHNPSPQSASNTTIGYQLVSTNDK